jgi:hypothetical protein
MEKGNSDLGLEFEQAERIREMKTASIEVSGILDNEPIENQLLE